MPCSKNAVAKDLPEAESKLREMVGRLGPRDPQVLQIWNTIRIARSEFSSPASHTMFLDLLSPDGGGRTVANSTEDPGAADKRAMRLIERSLDIGDTRGASLDIEGWRGQLQASPNSQISERFRAAELQLAALLEFERCHGRACLLDRTADEVI